MNEEIEDFEETDTIFCTLCGEDIQINEWTQHLEDKHTEKKSKEELSDLEILTMIKLAILSEEKELNEKYGYIIPKSKETLSKLSEGDQEKHWMIRAAMVEYSRVKAGLQDFNPSSWIIPPEKTFVLSDYKMGENIFGVEADSEEQVKAFAAKYSNKNWTKEEIEELIRNPSKFLPKIEKLAEKKKDHYLEIAEKLRDKFIGLWDDSKGKEGGRTLNEQMTLMLSKEIFGRYKCPVCSYSLRGAKLSRAEKYAKLIRHYDEVHLQKLKGRTSLTTVERIDLGPDTSLEAEVERVRKVEFTAEAPVTAKGQELESGPLMEHQTGSPNPEQCHKSESPEKLSDVIRDPVGTALPSVEARQKQFEELTKRTDKGTKYLARVFSKVAPNPEELKEIKEDYKDFYYEMPKGQFVCEACFAKFKTFRKFWTHFQTEHQRMAKQPSKYRNYFKDRYSKK